MSGETAKERLPEKIGKYKVTGAIGQGSMGVVYRAVDPEIGRTVAIKTMQRISAQTVQMHGTDTALERFRNEARSAGNLRHPNIITVFEVNVQGDLPYIVMDYVEGESLYSLIGKYGRLEPARVISYLAQVASALDYAHQRGVFHRDIKPSNLIVDRQGTVFVLDFGVASITKSYSEWDTPVSSQPVVGTPGYMAPEQILNEGIDNRADLFSLGVVAFECFSGGRPYEGEDIQALMRATVHAKPKALSAVCAELPLSLETELEKALARQRFERFNTATEMVSAFASALSLPIAGGGPLQSGVLFSQGTASPPFSATSGGYPKTVQVARGADGDGADDPHGSGGALPPLWPAEAPPPSIRAHSNRGPSVRMSGGWGTPDSPGDVFRQGDRLQSEMLRRTPRSAAARTPAQRLLMGGALIGIGVGALLVWLSFSDHQSTVATLERAASDSGRAITSFMLGSEGGEPHEAISAFGPLINPPSDPVPTGKTVEQMTDREILGVFKANGVAETLSLDALREAERRRMVHLVDALQFVLQHDSYIVRVEAIKLLGALGDRRIVPALLPRLDDHDPVVRGFAARTLGELGDRAALPYIMSRLLQEDEPAARRALERAVERLGGALP